MAAFRTLIMGELAPVGQPVSTGRAASPPEFPSYSAQWTSSGTAALALALRFARERRSDVRAPQVVLPAYGCPDLITAARLANVEPVLVDVEHGAPGYDLDALRRALCDAVVAVVAVNFLGIREQIAAVRAITGGTALLVEDCAQWFPEGALDADLVVLSFGRGKPVNLLGGGGLLVKQDLQPLLRVPPPGKPSVAFRARAAAFNLALRPVLYAWLTSVPLLSIGETRYRSSATVQGMDALRLSLLGRNAEAWLTRPRWREAMIEQLLGESTTVLRLPSALADRAGRLLRYPLLAAVRSERDQALAALQRRGLGASPLYGVPLNQVRDVPAEVAAQGPFPAAQAFADRLLTLPMHNGVTAARLASMANVLSNVERGARVTVAARRSGQVVTTES